jgi:hypothetical protein
MTNSTIRHVARLARVREVSLLGTADLAFWKARLQAEGLVPAEAGGKAQVLIIAADSPPARGLTSRRDARRFLTALDARAAGNFSGNSRGDARRLISIDRRHFRNA